MTLKGTEKVHLGWGNFCSSWSISNEEICSTEQMLLTEFYFLYSSLGCITRQNRREAEGKHKLSSYFMVLHFPSGPGPGVPGSVGWQAGQPWGPRPTSTHSCAEVPRACDVEQDRVPTVARTSYTKLQESQTSSFKTDILQCAKNKL